MIGGCGGDLFVPMESLVWHEVDLGGAAPFIALTEHGIVYTAYCQRYETSLFRPATGERVPFFEGDLIRPAVSADGQKVAGLVRSDGGKLGIVDLATLAETIVPTSEAPSIITWGADGSLYYAAVSQMRLLLDGLSQSELDAVGNPITGMMSEVGFNRVRLYRIAPDGTETLLHEQEAYGVGRLALHGSTLVYSTISNGDAWIQAMIDGTVNGENAYERAEDFLTVTVNYLTLDAGGSVTGGGSLPGKLQRFAVAP
jgi:hypothetical protein